MSVIAAIKYAWIYIPTGVIYLSMSPRELYQFAAAVHDPNTCIEEWISIPVPPPEYIAQMNLSQVI